MVIKSGGLNSYCAAAIKVVGRGGSRMNGKSYIIVMRSQSKLL